MVWSSVQALITLIHIILILYKRKQKKFEPNIEALYVNVFKDVLSRWEFKLLSESCINVEKAKSNNTQVVKAGNPFEELIIVGDLENSNSHLELLRLANSGGEEEVLLDRMTNWSWVGVIEYITMYEKSLRSKVTFKDDQSFDYGVTLNVRKAGLGAIVYRVNVENLLKLYKNKTHGLSIKNAILARMLCAVSHVVSHRQKSYIDLMKQVKRQDTLRNKETQLEVIVAKQEQSGSETPKSDSYSISDPSVCVEESIDKIK